MPRALMMCGRALSFGATDAEAREVAVGWDAHVEIEWADRFYVECSEVCATIGKAARRSLPNTDTYMDGAILRHVSERAAAS